MTNIEKYKVLENNPAKDWQIPIKALEKIDDKLNLNIELTGESNHLVIFYLDTPSLYKEIVFCYNHGYYSYVSIAGFRKPILVIGNDSFPICEYSKSGYDDYREPSEEQYMKLVDDERNYYLCNSLTKESFNNNFEVVDLDNLTDTKNEDLLSDRYRIHQKKEEIIQLEDKVRKLRRELHDLMSFWLGK